MLFRTGSEEQHHEGGQRSEGPHVTVTLADIERRAHHRRAGAAHADAAGPKLSALTGAQVFVKYENLQVTNSFKERGALTKLAALARAERARGVIAMSAGNHAQAVAYHAQRLGIPGDHRDAGDHAVREGRGDRGLWGDRGADGETVADAQVRAEAIAAERQLVWVHPYDDPQVIAGQGTIALEMLEDAPISTCW
jgi:threonine dehydratase